MSDRQPKKAGVEVTSQTLQDELSAIKDRLTAIEIISSVSNAAEVKKYVEDHLKTDQSKAIMAECSEPRTKSHLIARFDFKSPQALDYHLKPMMKDQLIRQRIDNDDTIVFEWSDLFRSLPRSSITSILKNTTNTANGAARGEERKRRGKSAGA